MNQGKSYSMTCPCRHRGVRQKYSSKPITTLAFKGVGGQHHAPIAVPPENTHYSLYQRLAGPRLVCKGSANLSPVGFDPQSVWLVASCYTGYIILVTIAYEYQ